MAILANIPPLFIVPLATGAHKTSDFVKHHTNQGIVIAIVSVVWGIVFSMISYALAFVPVIGWMFTSIIGLTSLLILALIIIGILNAVNGKKAPLPVVGGINILK